MKTLKIISSRQYSDTGALDTSDTIYSGALAASTEQTVTVPTGADFVRFEATGDFYVNYDTTATVPSGTISEAGGELNPDVRYIGETTTLHIISAGTPIVTLAFYSK